MFLSYPVVIIGVDPGMAEGKPIAAVPCGFGEGETVVLYPIQRDIPLGASFMDKLLMWWETIAAYAKAVPLTLRADGALVCVACETARGVGGSGWALQALVTFVREIVEQKPMALFVPVIGISRFIPVNPSEAKKYVAANGRADAETVARFVEAIVRNPQNIPPSKEYDYHAACAVAITAYRKLCAEQLLLLGDGNGTQDQQDH